MAGLRQLPLLKTLFSVTPLSLLGHGGTFLIYALLANWFGATAGTDFIYYYWGITVFLIELLSASSGYSVLVPLLAAAKAEGEAAAQACVQGVFSLYILAMPVCCVSLTGLCWLVSSRFLDETGLPFSSEIVMILCFACFTLISSIRWMLKAILDTYRAFHFPVIVQGVRALVVIATIYLCKRHVGLFSIPIALILGELFQGILLFWRCCVTLNLSPNHFLKLSRLNLHWHENRCTQQFVRQCFLMMGAAISDGMNPVVDRGMASLLGVSSVSKLDYALRLCAIPEALTGVTLPVFLSHWAGKATLKPNMARQVNQASRLKESVVHSVVGILILMVPFLLGCYLFVDAIVDFLYGHGELSVEGLESIGSLLGIYLIGLLPRLLSRLMVRAHLAFQNHTTVLMATLIRFILNPALNWVLMRLWGLEGIAWSTTFLSYPIFAFIAIMLWRKF